jgi:putative two-component system response regulator
MMKHDPDSISDVMEYPSDEVATQLWHMSDAVHYGCMNAAHAIFLGKNRRDAEHASVYDLFSSAEADTLVAQNQLVFTSRNPSIHDMWLQNTDREKRLLRVIRTPILNRDGDVLFLSCSAEDLTNAQPSETQTPSNWNESSEEFVQGKVQQLADALWGTITALVCLAESRDDNTGGHLRRISETCRVVATALSLNSVYSEQLTREFIINLQQACLLHDIGKVGIPDSILLKRGKLTTEEFDEMKKHTTIGAQTLESAYQHCHISELIKMGMDIALSHHERWDGLGYPNGLKGNEIPLSAQIVAIADVYDALRSTRCYKTASSHEDSLAEIRKDIGHRFNPVVAKAFLRYEREIEQIYQGYDL